MTEDIQQAIAKAKAYGDGTIPIPGKKAYRDAVFEYSSLPLEKLESLIDKANQWLEENKILRKTAPIKWIKANAKVQALREAHARCVASHVS